MKSNGRTNGNGRHPRNGNGTVASGGRAAIYCRLSVERPDQELSSVTVQRDRCEAYAASQGWTVLPDRFDDDGFSGATTHRPGLTRLLAEVERGGIDVLVTVRIDRLSRSMLDFLKIMETLDRHGVALVSITQEVNTATAWGRMVLNILAGFGQFEREMISERTRDKIHAARRSGKWTGGFIPLGYDLVDGKLIVNERESLQVHAIFEIYLAEGSLSSTLREIRKRGWTMKRWTTRQGSVSGGGLFTRSGLYTLLTNSLYIGKVKLDGEVFAGEHAAILEQDVFGAAQAQLRSNGLKRAAASRNAHGAFLKGVLYCAHCNARMIHTVTRKGSKGYRYYVCGNAQREGWQACPVKSVAAGAVEAAVLQEIREAVQDTALARETWDEVVRQRQVRTRDLVREEKIEAAGGNGRLARVQSELTALRRATFDRGDLAEALDSFAPLWDALTYSEQSELAGHLLERVDFDGEAATVHLARHTKSNQSGPNRIEPNRPRDRTKGNPHREGELNDSD